MVIFMTNTQQPDALLSPSEAAKELGITTRTLRRYVDAGKLERALKLPSGHARYRLSDVQELAKTSAA